jgi:hypothetical protein
MGKGIHAIDPVKEGWTLMVQSRQQHLGIGMGCERAPIPQVLVVIDFPVKGITLPPGAVMG